MARACLPRLGEEALRLLFAQDLSAEDLSAEGGGDWEALEEHTGGRGGELSVRDGSLSRSRPLGSSTSRPPRTID